MVGGQGGAGRTPAELSAAERAGAELAGAELAREMRGGGRG